MDLGQTPQQMGNLIYPYLLPVLVAFTSWWQSKMMTRPARPIRSRRR